MVRRIHGGAAPPSAYAAEVLADSPALYWRLGESSGTTAQDETANNRDGTYGSGVTLGTAGALVGDANTAVSLDDTLNGRITSSYNPFANGSQRTFEGWAWRNSIASGNFDALFGGQIGGNVSPAFYLEANNQNVRFVPVASGSESVWTAAWPGNAQWVHWVLTFDEPNDVAELFINGVSQGTRTETEQYSATPGDFQVGALRNGPATDPFNGRMDEIAIYGSILSSARVLAHYEAGT